MDALRSYANRLPCIIEDEQCDDNDDNVKVRVRVNNDRDAAYGNDCQCRPLLLTI